MSHGMFDYINKLDNSQLKQHEWKKYGGILR